MRRRYLTPPTLPIDTQCRGLVVPASQEWLAVFSQALLDTTYAHFYEQLNPTDLTPEQAAAAAYQIYTDWLQAECAGAPGSCRQPSNRKVYRQNPTTGVIEYLEDEAWVTDTTIPATEARTETTDEERICAAATNAVHVLRLTWLEGMSLWDNEISATDAYVDQSLQIAGLIGVWFYPPIVGMLALTQLGWEVVYYAYEFLTAVDWDFELTQLLICLFQQHATVTDGVVHFDYRAIMHDLWGMALSGQAYLTIVGQLEYMVFTIGQQAIDAAGALTAYEGDCSCGNWSRRWEFADLHDGSTEWVKLMGLVLADQSLQPTGVWPGRFAAVTCTVPLDASTHIFNIDVWAYYPASQYCELYRAGGSNSWVRSGSPAAYPTINHYPIESPSYMTDVYHNAAVSMDGAGVDVTFTIAARTSANNFALKGIRIVGSGPCPFTTGFED